MERGRCVLFPCREWSIRVSYGRIQAHGATPIRANGTAGTPRPWRITLSRSIWETLEETAKNHAHSQGTCECRPTAAARSKRLGSASPTTPGRTAHVKRRTGHGFRSGWP